MVVAQMGLAMKVISTEVYAVVVFMAVATTLVTPLLLKIAFRDPTLEPARAFDRTGSRRTLSRPSKLSISRQPRSGAKMLVCF